MSRPSYLCHLSKDKLIDTQIGFVDTFNWMVDYINNLRGEEPLEINNPTGTNPTIKIDLGDYATLSSDISGGGDFDIIAGDDTNLVVTKEPTAEGKTQYKIDVYYL